jgi:hypothetical protein
LFLFIQKNISFAVRFSGKVPVNTQQTKKQHSHEKNISTLGKEKKKQTWVPGKNGNCQRTQSSCCPQGKRQKEINRF